jgi:transposase
MLCMYIRLTRSKKSKHPTLQIVEGVREGKKVKQKIVASLGVIKGQDDLKRLEKLAEHLMQKLQKEGLQVEHKARIKDLIHKKTFYDGFTVVLNRLIQLAGFEDVLCKAQGKNSFDVEKIIKLILVQRLDLPSSKLRTYQRQQDHGFCDIDLQHVYRAMDAIQPFSSEFQKQAFNTSLKYSEGLVDCFFFDVTTLYFESVEQDELREFGFSKDQKYHLVQIVLALVVNSQGVPLAYEVFKGNLAETKTLVPVLNALRERFSISNVTVVCDRGLASRPNVEALQDAEFHFVIATKLRSISKKFRLNDLSTYKSLPDQDTLPDDEKILFLTMEHPQYKDTLLISTYSPSRAKKDREDRERLLDKLRKKLSHANDETSVKNVISNSGYKKFTNIKDGSQITIDEDAVECDAAWDGFHGIAVSNSAKLTVQEALERYRDLWRVEEAFRVAKCTLKTRPIFHRKPDRIRTHVLLCFLNLFLERFLELLLRMAGKALTPDRIKYALAGIHTIVFEDQSSSISGCMHSILSEDAKTIFEVLGIIGDRTTSQINDCCV